MTEYDCLTCGACCHAGANYVQLYAEDLVRLGARAKTLAVRSTQFPLRAGETGAEMYLDFSAGHCAALQHVGDTWPCSIYEDRPLLCRVFEPGTKPCLDARARRGIH